MTPLVSTARLTHRRLRAASRTGSPIVSRRAAELDRWLQRARRMDHPAVVNGPYAYTSGLASFLRDYRYAIDAVLPRPGRMTDNDLVAHSNNQRRYEREHRAGRALARTNAPERAEP